MFAFIFKMHQHWRYMIFLFAVVALLGLLIGMFGKKSWRPLGRVSSLLFVIMVDIQFLLGMIVWVYGQHWNGVNPVRSWEHPTTMVLALAAAHMGSVMAKKEQEDSARYKKMFIGCLLSVILIVAGIYRVKGGLP